MDEVIKSLFIVIYLVLYCHAHNHGWMDSYDYIVVGSGAGGSVVASRLSEDRRFTVLLLEAGGEADDPFIRVPGNWFDVYSNPELDWGYKTEPQKRSNKSIPWGQAKVLGGCTSHNGMVYTRGSPHDFDRWAEMGNYNWSYKDVLPYFKKSEMVYEDDLVNKDYRGLDGPMTVRIAADTPFSDSFLSAANTIGLKQNIDSNAEMYEGIGKAQFMVNKAGERDSTYEAFVKPVRGRWNLKILTHAHVTKLSFDTTSSYYPLVNGVHFNMYGEMHHVMAKREVIVCAGVIGSPALLLRSGIGPSEHLKSFGIDVMADLPVGENLVDQHAIILPMLVDSSGIYNLSDIYTFESLFNHLFTGTGRWSLQDLVLSFSKSDTQPATDKFPYLEQVFKGPSPYLAPFTDVIENVHNGEKVPAEMIKQVIDAAQSNIYAISESLLVLHPRYSGRVMLENTDPMANPKIDHQYFSHPDDVKDMIQNVRILQAMLRTDVMQIMKADISFYKDPTCTDHEYDSDAYWECYFYNNAAPSWHLSSSCKMAPDSTGVLDDRLRVKNIMGLRVADASIMPMPVSAHPTAATIMIGEKAADMIKEAAVFPNPPIPDGGRQLYPNFSLCSAVAIMMILLTRMW